MKQKQIELFCFCFVLLIILLGFYFPWLSGQQSFYLSDLTYYFEPLSRFVGEALRHGRIPLWNPYSFCGMPEIAIPSPGIFYPLAWQFAVLPFSKALALSMVLHQFIAGLGSYLLIASLGWGAVPAAVFGFSIALCGYMFSLQANYTLIDTAAWIPFCLWALREIDASRSLKNASRFLIACLCCFMLLSAGRPEVSTPGLLLLLAFTVITSLGAQPRMQVMILKISAIVCGVMLSAPTLLPSAEWASLSARAHGLAPNEIFLWSANWYDFVVMILAHPLGDLHILGNKFLTIGASRANYVPYVSSAFIGPVVFTLALWGLFDCSWKYRSLLLIMLIGVLIMTLGNFTPIAPWIVSLTPALSVFRYPEKLLIFFTGVVALFAARGTYLSCNQQVNKFGALFTWMLWGAWCSICLFFLLLPYSGQGIVSIWRPHNIDFGLFSRSLMLFEQAGFAAGIIGLLVCGLNKFSLRFDAKTYSITLLSALLSTLLVSAWFTSRHGTEPSFYEHPAFMQQTVVRLSNQLVGSADGPRVLSLCFDPLAYPLSFKGFQGEQYTPSFYQYGRQMLLPNTHMDANMRSSYGYEGAETAEYRKLFWGVFKQSHAYFTASKNTSKDTTDLPLYRFCQMTSTGYVYTQANVNKQIVLPFLDKQYFDLKAEDQNMNVRVYAVVNALPRVYFPRNWLESNSSKDIIHSLINGSSFDPAQTAFIETSAFNLLNSDQSDVQVSDLHLKEINPENISISMRLDKQALMILADHYYPGWEARIDNKLVPIYRANGILRAVCVPAGSHIIEFVYKPQSLSLAFGIALLAILFAALVAMYLSFKRFKF